MAESPLEVRLKALRQAQNSDGGWGYFPGKESWLEPTAYAALALHGEPASDRAWKLLQSWQLADGSWKPARNVNVSNWGASLCVTIAAARGDWGDPARRAVAWLVNLTGSESDPLAVFLTRIGIAKAERDTGLKAWPWKPGNSGWLEPTVHAIVALQQASAQFPSPELNDRIRKGQAQLLDVRGADGGWNYGSPRALGVDLPSYPETTALALVGLQENQNLGNAFALAQRMMETTPQPLARAWLTIALRLHGQPAPEIASEPSRDVMITAVEALAAQEGKWGLLAARPAARGNSGAHVSRAALHTKGLA